MIAQAAPRRQAIEPFSLRGRSMGGRLEIHLDLEGTASNGRPEGEARASAARAMARVDRWASRLSRHSDVSELSALNADPRREVPVGPTLAGGLRAGRLAGFESGGLVDISLLDERLAAEGLAAEGFGADRLGADRERSSSEWSISAGRRWALVNRSPGLRFDLGGVAKGWLADRALGLLECWPGAVVDADGDLALHAAPGRFWEVAVDDPRRPDTSLALLRLGATAGVPARWGVATSGTSIHRGTVDGRATHHLIDPRTGRPAETDVVQATVVAGTALRAEALAKAAVIAGSVEGFALLDRSAVAGAILLTDRGDVLALPQTMSLLES